MMMMMMMTMLAYTIVSSTAKKKNPWHACPTLQGKRTLLPHKRIWFVPVVSYTKIEVTASQKQQNNIQPSPVRYWLK